MACSTYLLGEQFYDTISYEHALHIDSARDISVPRLFANPMQIRGTGFEFQPKLFTGTKISFNLKHL